MRITIAAAALAALGTAAGAQTIVDIAAGDERFTTLVAAVQAADLVDTLSGPGPFTVYAPLNSAFEALPEGTVESLLEPSMKDDLTDVLLYHVDDRRLRAIDFPHGATQFKPLLTSERLCVTSDGSGVSVADGTGESAAVVVADIEASNGVIHVIDKVLLPGTRPDCR